MYLMIELDGSGILLAATQRCELRMASIETADVGHKLRMSILILGREIGVALRANTSGGPREPHGTLVFHMAFQTSRRKGLLGMMDGTVMASQARPIGHRLLETSRGNVAGSAFVSNQC